MTMTQPDVLALWKELEAQVAAGDRFAGLFATAGDPGRPRCRRTSRPRATSRRWR